MNAGVSGTTQVDLTGKLALDTKSVNDLRQAARENSPEAIKATAKQFEALFMNMMLKSMRQATPQDSPFDSEQSRMYTSMLDQQLSQNMASRGVGLADVLIRQLSNVVGAASVSSDEGSTVSSNDPMSALQARILAYPPDKTDSVVATPSTADAGQVNAAQPKHVQDFHAAVATAAEDASRMTGIPAKFMIGQAALETGWGKHQIKSQDGSNSHNLFGIKAGANWKGKTVSAVTTEYVDGAPQQRVEKFRAYDSYADSFRDYAKLLRDNPRYEKVLANSSDAASFARGLQKAGYATDPKYAAKLTQIINRTMTA